MAAYTEYRYTVNPAASDGNVLRVAT